MMLLKLADPVELAPVWRTAWLFACVTVPVVTVTGVTYAVLILYGKSTVTTGVSCCAMSCPKAPMKGLSTPNGAAKRDSAHGISGYRMSFEEKGSPPTAGEGANGSAMCYRLRLKPARRWFFLRINVSPRFPLSISPRSARGIRRPVSCSILSQRISLVTGSTKRSRFAFSLARNSGVWRAALVLFLGSTFFLADEVETFRHPFRPRLRPHFTHRRPAERRAGFLPLFCRALATLYPRGFMK